MTPKRDIVWQLELIAKGGAVGLGEEWRRERCAEAAAEIERMRKIEKAAHRVSEAQLMSSEQFNAMEALDDALGINSPQPETV